MKSLNSRHHTAHEGHPEYVYNSAYSIQARKQHTTPRRKSSTSLFRCCYHQMGYFVVFSFSVYMNISTNCSEASWYLFGLKEEEEEEEENVQFLTLALPHENTISRLLCMATTTEIRSIQGREKDRKEREKKRAKSN